MPEMTGIEFLEELRAKGDRTPFGFVTSQSADAVRSQAAQSGARFLITEPFTPDAFAQALEVSAHSHGQESTPCLL